jgi:hypothetical protein
MKRNDNNDTRTVEERGCEIATRVYNDPTVTLSDSEKDDLFAYLQSGD